MPTEREQERLALQGGMKAVSTIEGKGQPKIGIDEFMAVATRFGLTEQALGKIHEILKQEPVGSGPFLANYYSGLTESCVQRFERIARETFGVDYAIATSSGTGALHAAFVAAGVGPGTEVICPAIGFFATASAVVMAGGVPIFADVDHSLNMDPTKLEAVISKRTVALAPTHVMGSVCDMPAIMAVARKHNLKVVEDCAQTCGGRVNGQLIGTFGDFGCFSISAYKIVGGGEGGLIITKEERNWERAQQVVESGGLWRPVRFAPPRYTGELYCGTNYRMSELEAAVDGVQLSKMEQTVARFRHVKRRIAKQLHTYREIQPQQRNDPDGDVGYSLRFFPRDKALSIKLAEALAAEGVGASTRAANPRDDWHIYYSMMPLVHNAEAPEAACAFSCPHYQERGGKPQSYLRGECPVADDLYERVINIGVNQWYTDADCDMIAAAINKVLDALCTRDDSAPAWC